jgi:hypothetical protein
MKPTEPKEAKQKRVAKKQLIKIMLMSGQKPLRADLDNKYHLTNSPELIRQLKEDGMDIRMERVPKKTEPGWQGRYYYVPPKKESRIASGEYREFATLKRTR